MKVFLNSAVDTSQLQEMKKASSLVEAPILTRDKKKKTLERYLKRVIPNNRGI